MVAGLKILGAFAGCSGAKLVPDWDGDGCTRYYELWGQSSSCWALSVSASHRLAA